MPKVMRPSAASPSSLPATTAPGTNQAALGIKMSPVTGPAGAEWLRSLAGVAGLETCSLPGRGCSALRGAKAASGFLGPGQAPGGWHRSSITFPWHLEGSQILSWSVMPLLLLNGTRWHRKHGTRTRETCAPCWLGGGSGVWGGPSPVNVTCLAEAGRLRSTPHLSAWILCSISSPETPYFCSPPTLPCKAPPFMAQATEGLKTRLVPRRHLCRSDPAHPLRDQHALLLLTSASSFGPGHGSLTTEAGLPSSAPRSPSLTVVLFLARAVFLSCSSPAPPPGLPLC